MLRRTGISLKMGTYLRERKMKMRNQNRAVLFAAATAAVAAMAGTHLSAAEVYWKGGAGDLTATNYTSDGTNTIPFTPGDIVNLGGHIITSDPNNSIVVTTSVNYGTLPSSNAPTSVHVGHNFGTLPGPASLFVKSGGLVLLGNPTATNAFDNAALVVGYNADGNFTVGDGINVPPIPTWTDSQSSVPTIPTTRSPAPAPAP